jgi:Xaa-Pro dipeptidase
MFDALYPAHVARLEREYARILDENGLDAVVLHAGSLKKRSEFDDQYWPLRPTPHFAHWLPLHAADSALVVAPGRRPRLVWLRDPSNFWERPPAPESDHWQASFEIVEETALAEVARHFPSVRRAFVGEDLSRAAEWGLDAVNPPSLLKALDRLRVTKSEYEFACVAEANRRAAAGHARVAADFRAGDFSELELHLAFLAATGQDDVETPYKNIVAAGAHAATLHHIAYGRRPSGAQSLLVDAGATCLGYCSDVTRTYAKGAGAGASAFAALVARVEAMQQQLCAEVAVGLPYEQLHERAHQRVAQILVELGVWRRAPDEAVAAGVTRAFFPHGLGHSLGLQCHDVGCAEIKPRADNPFLRNTTVIAPDQLFTVEPGVYFIASLLEPLRAAAAGAGVDWRLCDELTPLGGVRIEDDVRVTARGADNLTRAHLPT